MRARWGPPAEHAGGEYREAVGGGAEEDPPVEGTEVALHTPQPPVLCSGFEPELSP